MKIFLVLFVTFMVMLSSCSKSSDVREDANNSLNTPIINPPLVYGTPPNKKIVIKAFRDATLYRPEVIPAEGVPVILVAPGWSSQNYLDYETLLSFMAKQGYLTIYVKSPAEYSTKTSIERYLSVLEDASVVEMIDKNQLGIVGHSSGGGIVFKLMDYFSKAGYGANGRFIFSMDPWFAFDMGKSELAKLPQNTHVVIQQYANHSSTDPRIALSIFDAISTLPKENIDYQVYKDLGHGYPMGSAEFSQKQIVLKPLDALIQYTFDNKEDAYKVALELGSDTPYENNYQPIAETSQYGFKCHDNGNQALKQALDKYDLDYCAIQLKF